MATVEQKDHYATFGVDQNATPDEIRKVYRKLAHKYHPDKTGGDRKAEERLKEINEAYDVLKNADKKKEYDQHRAFAAGGFPGFNFSARGFTREFGEAPFADIFGSMFGRGGAASARPAVRRGNDIEGIVRISLKDVIRGTSKTIRLRRSEFCNGCNGSGAAPGTSPIKCDACDGTGMQTRGNQRFRLSQTCAKCQGHGTVVSTPCSACSGSGHTMVSREIKVDIPAGIYAGTRLRLAGEGEAGDPGAPKGDLYVLVDIEPHSLFERDGADLICEVPVTFADAALGATIRVPTLDGMADINIEAGTQHGTLLRMRGLGLVRFQGDARGDELIKVIVEIPTKLSREQKNLLKELDRGVKPKAYPLISRFRKLIGRRHGPS